MKYFFCFIIIFFSSCQVPVDKKTIKICINREPESLDPRKSNTVASAAVIFNLFSGLTELKTDGTIAKALAKSIDISEDKKRYTFFLKDEKWSDGKEITAYDFERSWKKVVDPDFPSFSSELFYPILNAEKIKKRKMKPETLGVKALDEKTLVVDLEAPCHYFLSLTAFCSFFAVPSHSDNTNKNFICSGPFKLKSWTPKNSIILERNRYFWNRENLFLDLLKINIVEDETTALNMFENGELDWIGSFYSPFPPDSIPTIIKEKTNIIREIGGTTFFAFNTKSFPFKNRSLRKAFSLSIDREEIVENITQTKEVVATRFVPPIISKKREKLFESNNIKKAKELFEKGLKELGIKREDLQLNLIYEPTLTNKKLIATIVCKWQKTFNITINLRQLEKKILLSRLHKKQFQFALSYLIAHYLDPTSILNRFKYGDDKKNYSSFENSEYISLLSIKEKDPKKRALLFEKLEKILADAMPIAPIYHHTSITLKKPNIKGEFIGLFGEPHFEKVYLVED